MLQQCEHLPGRHPVFLGKDFDGFPSANNGVFGQIAKLCGDCVGIRRAVTGHVNSRLPAKDEGKLSALHKISGKVLSDRSNSQILMSLGNLATNKKLPVTENLQHVL